MKIDISKPFGKALREVRLESKLTQENLAYAAGLDRTYISLLERGQRKPSLECVLLLALALNLNTVTLLSRFLTYFNSEDDIKDCN